MKLLIVDDESHVIRGIKMLLQREALGIDQVLEATSAMQAIAVIERERPEILLSDVVMPDLSGLDLIEHIHQAGMLIKVVVISGHNDFDYIRTVLRHGGVDYLLKPIAADALNAAVAKAVEAWNREASQRQQTQEHFEIMRQMQGLQQTTLLYRMMTQPLSGRYHQKLLNVAPTFAAWSRCAVGYHTCRYHYAEQDFQARIALSEYGAQLHALLAAQGKGVCFANPGDDRELLMLCDGTEEAMEILDVFIGQMEALGEPFSLGVSRAAAFPDSLPQAREQAEQAFLSQYTEDRVGRVIRFDPAWPPRQAVWVVDAQAKDMLSALITGNEDHMGQEAKRFLSQALPRRKASIADVCAALTAYNQITRRWYTELADRYPNLSLHPGGALTYNQLLQGGGVFSREQFEKRINIDMLQIFGELTGKETHPGNNVIHQVAQYIELNFRKPFSQFQCAQLFYINKDYMCRKFKATYRINMIAYLTNLRIQEAKRLLVDPKLRVQDIAAMVGFEDEKYFSKQFGRIEGVPPSEYRMRCTREMDPRL